jgi:LacI family transcriptional regulator
MKRRPTVEDVARRAGVSLMTVSRVVNRAPKVAPGTRARVQAAIDELGFVPNRAARSLRSQRSHWIAVLGRTPDPAARPDGYSYLAELQNGVIGRCRQDGYHVAFDSVAPDGDAIAAVRELAQRLAPDGVILIPPLSDDGALLDEIRALGLPAVRIGPRERGDDPAPCVLLDDRTAATEMTEYLLNLGHRRIGFIRGHPDHVSSAQRLAGFRAALKEHRLLPQKGDIVPGLFTAESGGVAARTLLARGAASQDPVTAIFASNDEMAAGCLAVAHELGLRVPGDLSIVGFDDTYVAAMLYPPLTTVRQPIYDMGYAAAHQLQRLMREGEATACVQLSHRLVERQTVGPPGADRRRERNGKR